MFDSVSFFLKVYIFVQQKTMDYLTLKRHNFFQNKNDRKATRSSQSYSHTSNFYVATRSLKIHCYLRELELPNN